MAASSTIDVSALSYDALGDLNERFYYLFEDHGNIDDLKLALSLAPELIEQSEKGLQKAQWMNVLSQQYDTLYSADGSPACLEAAVRYARDAINEFPKSNDGDLLELKLNLERLLWKQYCAEKTIQNLKGVIAVSQEVIELRSREDSGVDLAIDLHNLGLRLHTLYRGRGKKKDLEDAVAAQRRALSCSDLDPELVVVFKVELGKKLNALYQATQSLELIVEAVELAEHLVDTTDRCVVNHADRVQTLSVRLRICASHSGCLFDYHNAILAAQKSILGTAANHPQLPMRLNDLSLALTARYEKLGSCVDLKASLEAIEQAVHILDEGSPDAATVSSTAADTFSHTFIQTGHLAHIEKAVAYREKSIAQTTPGNPVLAGRMSNLSNDLMLLYNRRGLVADINRAAEAGYRGLSLASDQDSAQRFTIRSVLSNALITRFERMGSLWDLHNGLEIAKKAFEQPPLQRLQARFVNNLAKILHLRYERLGHLDDLTSAIDSMGLMLASKTGSLEEQLTIMINLASMLRIRASATAGPASSHDLLRAKLLSYFVADHTPENHRDYPVRLNTLGNILHLLYQKSDGSKSVTYLRDAIGCAEHAVSCSSDSPERASILIALANFYEIQSQKSANDGYLDKSLNCYLDAWQSSASSPLKRINAATFAADIMGRQGDYERASTLIKDALRLVPLASARSLARGDQQHVLSQLSGLGSLGCSMALQAGHNPEDALQILEMGRGTILGNTLLASAPELGDDSDTTALYERYFALLHDLNRQAVENEYVSRTSSQFSITATVDEQYAVMEAIRGRPGHEHFQMPPSPREMQAAAADGVVVVICSTKLRTDAIIVQESRFLVVTLPEVSFQEVFDRAKLISEDLTSYTLRTLTEKCKRFGEQMHWLWCNLVSPILRALGLEAKTSIQELARIRWVGVGVWGVFPFHAAGTHSPGSTDNTLAYAISSYAPTIRSLVHASKKTSPIIIKPRANGMLFVGMPETARHRELIEVRTLQQSLQELKYDIQFLEQNIPSQVLACLSQYDMLLCACHGIADGSDPSESYLALQAMKAQPEPSPKDEDSDPFDAILNGINLDGRLTVRAISYQNRGQSSKRMPRLAFLMACSTATIKNLELSDETLHLASAFHLAGCQHVIGTMWQAIQGASINVALHFYASIARQAEVQRNEVSDAWRITAALHEAMLSVRQVNPTLILKWAPFMHIGP